MDEDGDISNKSRFELASLDVEKAEILSRKEMFIGTDTKNHMKKLDLSPSASKMDWFFEGVMKFYKTVVKYLLKYFSKALLSPVMDSFSGLSQKKRSSFGMAAPKLKNLVTTYPKVVSNDCAKCKTKTAHCHCSSFVITTHIREECSKARGRYEDYRQIVNSEKVVQNEAFVKKREKAEGDVKEKFERRKVKIANKMNYFSAQLDPVYDKNKKKKSVKDVVDSEKAPNNNNNSDSRKRKNNNPSVSSTMAKASKK